MRKTLRIALIVLLLLTSFAATAWFLATHKIAVLQPKGAIAIQQRDLFVQATWLMLIVVVPVFVMTLGFAWRYRASNRKAKYTPDWSHSHLAEVVWWGVPFIIIGVLGAITWTSTQELNPFKPLVSDKKPTTIQVVALQWKWLFIYPEQGIATVNFVQFPKETPIHFEITADAPMNSFWIPELGGQIYAMAAMKTQLHLIANEAGEFRGCSAQLSGTGFAGMHFVAKASSQEEFDAWASEIKGSSPSLTLEEYGALARPSSYDPVATYALPQGDLFNHIIMKYM